MEKIVAYLKILSQQKRKYGMKRWSRNFYNLKLLKPFTRTRLEQGPKNKVLEATVSLASSVRG
jgi:hypothetical protein